MSTRRIAEIGIVGLAMLPAFLIALAVSEQ